MKIDVRVLIALILTFFAQVCCAQQTAANYKEASRYSPSGVLLGTITTDPDGSGSKLTYMGTEYDYYQGSGLLRKVSVGSLRSWPDDSVLPSDWGSYGFDVHLQTEYYYDDFGRKSKVATLGRDGEIEKLKEYTYDSRNRVKCEITRMNPNNFSSLIAQDTKCIASSEGDYGKDRIIRYTYNGLDQVTEVRRDYASQPSVVHRKKTYISNAWLVAVGNSQVSQTYYGSKLDTTTDANNNLTDYSYDKFLRLEKIIYPSKTLGAGEANVSPASNSGDFVKFGYDENGNVTSERKRGGALFAYTYDKNNLKTFKNGPGSSLDVSYDYDLRGLQLSAKFGSDSGQGVTNNFDGFGNLLSSSVYMGGATRKVSYQYDLNNNRVRITHPDSKYFEYFFDQMDRAYRIRANGSTLVWIDYDNAGRRDFMARNYSRNGAPTDFVYDNAGRLRSLQQNLAGSSQDFLNTFTYNPANQITSVHFANTQYHYSGNDNLVGDYVVNGLNQYTAINNVPYDYDDNGNLESDGNKIFVYDSENRLIQTVGDAVTNLKYDPLGRLFEVKTGTQTQQFLYDGDNLIAEYSSTSTNTPSARYVFGQNMDEPLVQYDSGVIGTSYRRFVHTDQQGSVIAVTNSSGTPQAVNKYDVFGIPQTSNVGRFGFTGQVWLDEVGLYYFKARMYSPYLGRFLQMDTVGYEADMNVYTYGNNDPVNAYDPKGESPISVLAKQTAKVGIKQALENMAKRQMRRLGKNLSEKEKKEFMGEFGDIVSSLDSSPMEIAFEFIPVLGDIYGGVKFTKEVSSAYGRMQDLENKWIAKIIAKLPPEERKKFITSMRNAGVRDAKKDQGIAKTGSGKHMHHNCYVKDFQELAADPRHIEALDPEEHRERHRGVDNKDCPKSR